MENLKNRMIKIFIKYFDYILLFLIATLFLGSFFGYFAPKLKEIQKIKDIKFVKGEEIYNYDLGYFEKLKLFYKEYEGITEFDVKKIDAALPVGLKFPELFAGLESLFKDSGFELGSVVLVKGEMKEDEKQKMPSVKIVKINLTINNVHGYQDYKKMLSILENNLPIIDVKSVDYKDDDTYSLELTTYYMEDQN